ncbi:MAG: dipicolinate synthase subunit DpsA [Firmicutes bacterium]|nr:dipicolinate synthase subunit DpsA [Bacillota bacterium]
MELSGVKIAVLGGDDRDLVLIPELIKSGMKINLVGFPELPELAGVNRCESIDDALLDVQAVLMPMPGTDASGVVRAVYAKQPLVLHEKHMQQLPPDTPLIIGVARPFLREWTARYRLRLTEIAELDHVAIMNSIPSAEGAIQIAMQELPITIHGSSSWVLGFGRVGQTLARMLSALGAHTTVCARKKSDLARIWEMGYQPVGFDELEERVGQAEILFNTVPSLVLKENVLKRCSPEVLIIDLASQPGGTDFQVAESLGIKAILAPGLPGKVAPKTAGRILARLLPELIYNEINRGKKTSAESVESGIV